MIVLDASATVELLLGLPAARQIQQLANEHEWMIAAPELLQIEVLQVLRRWVRSGNISEEEATEALELLDSLGIRYFGHEPLQRRIWELRANLTAYDATYVALAEMLNAPVLTTDAHMGNAPGNEAEVLAVLPA